MRLPKLNPYRNRKTAIVMLCLDLALYGSLLAYGIMARLQSDPVLYIWVPSLVGILGLIGVARSVKKYVIPRKHAEDHADAWDDCYDDEYHDEYNEEYGDYWDDEYDDENGDN